MAFLVENDDGTIVGANSYASVAELDTYFLDRGVEMSLYPPVRKEHALVLATDHIDLFFGKRMLGYRLLDTQALQFPRIYLYDEFGNTIEGIPLKLKYATFEYAHRQLVSDAALVPDPVVNETGMQVQTTYEKVGPIEERITFNGSAPRIIVPYPKADAYLCDFLFGGYGGSHRA